MRTVAAGGTEQRGLRAIPAGPASLLLLFIYFWFRVFMVVSEAIRFAGVGGGEGGGAGEGVEKSRFPC